ncbi:endothelial cell-specific chemotaxis regulator [Ochotona curzoniae]|uniref:endothelial cell-specific chemotaxis regulator n=1 Tax=Ochotona curzoniae TaxID=130825 RepID=UPI001B353FBD|nr:endothelial cell-specific chemotaxis regulator [Ochotona curzoniae]
MGNVGAVQLCCAILGFLLLQGHNSQPIASQTSSSQGTFSRQTVSPITGDITSLEPNSLSPLSTTGTTVAPRKGSVAPMEAGEAVTSKSGTMDGHSAFVLGLTESQPQKHTLGLDTRVPGDVSSVGDGTSEDRPQDALPKSTTMSLRTREDLSILPTPTTQTVLTVAAFGVISFIVVLVVVVIVLVSVVSLRFKCRKNKESEDPQKPGNSGLSESCSTANGEKDSITLISMKNINTNNSKGCPLAEKVL